MRRFASFALSTVSFGALALAAAAPAAAQDTANPDQSTDCAVIADEAAKQACLEKADDTDPLSQEGSAATIPPEAAPASAEGQGTIVVTGSRLRRTEFNSPDPIQIINPDVALKEGDIETAEILQTSPLAAGSTQITSVLSSNFVTNGGPGAQTISLRGLGAERTLVLLNGRRAGPAGTRGAIASFDLNTIPTSAIKSVEILKTGASSVYGSDAIAGVVNLITKKDLEGLELNAFTSLTKNGAGDTYSLSGIWGKTFERGHIMVGADYFKRTEVARKDRDFLDCSEDFVFRPDGTRADILDPRTGQPMCNGIFGPVIALADFQELTTDIFTGVPTTNLVTPGGIPITAIQFNGPGDRLDEFLPPLATPTSPFFEFGAPGTFFPVNFDGPSTGLTNLYPDSERNDTVIPKTKRYTIFADASFELTPNIELFAEGLYNKRKTWVNATRQLFPQQFTGSSTLPFLFGFSPNILDGDPMNTEFQGDVILIPLVITDHFDSSTDVDYYRGVLGAKGDFGSGFLNGWYWDAYFQHSRSEGEYTQDIIFQDSVDTQELRVESCVGTVTAVRGVPCMDVDFTDPRVLAGQFNQAERDFLLGVDVGNTLYKQNTFEASFGGNVIDLPAGPVKMSIGGQWRRDEIRDVPGEATLANNSWGLTGAGVTAGYTRTLEGFGELEVPLVSNTPFIKELTVNGAARVTNVYAKRASDGIEDSSNGNWTYKLGANWQVTDWLRLRGTYGTSYRAPALFEQFLADQTSFAGQIAIDPCINLALRLAQGLITQRLVDNCTADGVPLNYSGGGTSSALVITGGGIGVVEPETSTAKTFSVILTPQAWLWEGGRFSLAVDYFDIVVKGEISQLGSASILSGCYNSEFFPDDPLCDLFTRTNDPTNTRDNQIIEVRDSFININRQRNKGIDVTANFAQDLGRLGKLNFLSQMTFQLDDKFALFEGTEIDDNGENGEPKFIGKLNVSYSNKPITVLYTMDVIGKTSDRQDLLDLRGDDCFNSNFRGGLICPVVKLDRTFYHSLSVTGDITDKLALTAGVSNLFDTKPPRPSVVGSGISTLGQAPVFGSSYDLLGRRFFFNVRARF